MGRKQASASLMLLQQTTSSSQPLPQFLILIGIAIVIGCLLNSERQVLATVQSIHVAVAAEEGHRLQHITQQQDQSLEVVWLASFPNSGTSYTLRLVQSATKTLTANNYGVEQKNHLEAIDTAHNSTGPYWAYIDVDPNDAKTERQKASKYVLTKTHCGGRCVNCYPRYYLQSFQSFRDACFATTRPVENPTPQLPFDSSHYSSEDVSKVIHLIRDPVDNIVSRYHNWRFNNAQQGDGTITEFRQWCSKLHAKTKKDESKMEVWGEELWGILKDVPCATDFFRYVQWHNMALATFRDLDLEHLVMYYEDYESKWETTKETLLNFIDLKQEERAIATPFVGGKHYRNHFTTDELARIRQGIQLMSSRSTWTRLQHYFDDTKGRSTAAGIVVRRA